MVNCGCCGKPIKVTRDKHYFDEKTKKRYHMGCLIDICEKCGKPIKKGTKFENEHGKYYHAACFKHKAVTNPGDPGRFICSECGCPVDLMTEDAFVSDGGAVHLACYKGKAPERLRPHHEHGQGEWYDWGTGEVRRNPIGPVLVAGAQVVGNGVKQAAIVGADVGGKGMVLTGKGMIWSGERLQAEAKKARGNPMKIASSKDIEELVSHFKKEYPKLPESTWDDFRAVCFEQRGAGKVKLKSWWTKTLRANSERLGCRKNPLPLIPIIAGMVAPVVIKEGEKLVGGMTAPKGPAPAPAVKNPKLKIGVGNSEVELKAKLGL